MSSPAFSGGHSGTVLCVDARTDGAHIASGGESGELCVWTKDGTLCHKYSQQQADCTSVCFSRTKETILYAAFGEAVKVFDLSNLQQPLDSFTYNEDEVNQIQLDENEHFLAACDDSGEIKIINLQDKKVYKTLRRKHTNICSTVCFRPKKPWEIFTGGMDCNLIHWDFSRPKCVNQFNMQELQDASTEIGAYMVNPPFVHHLAVNSSGKNLAVALENGQISIFDTSRKNIAELFSLHAHSQGVSQVHFLDDLKLISGGNDSSIALWDLNKPNEVGESSHTLETNGSSAPQNDRNADLSEICKVMEINHTSKINWLKPFVCDNQKFVVIADQTANLTVLPI